MATVPGFSTQRNKINEAYRNGEMTKLERDSAIEDLKLFASDGRLSADEKASIANEIGESQSNAAREAGTDTDPVVTIDPVDPDGSGGGPPGTAPEGFQWVWLNNTWTLQQVPDTTEPEPVDNTPYGTRASARIFLEDLFKQLGFTANDITSLMSSVDSWIGEGLADVGNEAILARFRQTDIYRNRFQGMAALRERGQAITEAEYVQMERSYRRVLSSYNLPTEFYDNYDDYAKFIAADVSAQELEDRVVAARQVLDNASSGVLSELQEYYGVDDGTAMSYLLGLTDADGVARQAVRSQQEIRSGLRAAQVGGAAERAGFSMGRSQSELLAGSTMGQTLDPFNPQTSAQLEATFNRARRTANRETTLAAIDQEDYSEMDTLQAAFGDDQKLLASERRARRERARFSGTAGAARSALSQSRNF